MICYLYLTLMMFNFKFHYLVHCVQVRTFQLRHMSFHVFCCFYRPSLNPRIFLKTVTPGNSATGKHPEHKYLTSHEDCPFKVKAWPLCQFKNVESKSDLRKNKLNTGGSECFTNCCVKGFCSQLLHLRCKITETKGNKM